MILEFLDASGQSRLADTQVLAGSPEITLLGDNNKLS
jgi:hypothetical protein